MSRTDAETQVRELKHADTRRNPASRGGSEPRRGLARHVVVALASIAVVALVVGYAFAAPTPELTVTVGQVVPQPGATAVVQGRAVEPDGSGLSGLRIDVRRAGAISGAAVSDPTGTFRVDLTGACGAYEVRLRTEWQGSALERRTRRRLCPGDALPLDARIVTQGHYLWVPGPR